MVDGVEKGGPQRVDSVNKSDTNQHFWVETKGQVLAKREYIVSEKQTHNNTQLASEASKDM